MFTDSLLISLKDLTHSLATEGTSHQHNPLIVHNVRLALVLYCQQVVETLELLSTTLKHVGGGVGFRPPGAIVAERCSHRRALPGLVTVCTFVAVPCKQVVCLCFVRTMWSPTSTLYSSVCYFIPCVIMRSFVDNILG